MSDTASEDEIVVPRGHKGRPKKEIVVESAEDLTIETVSEQEEAKPEPKPKKKPSEQQIKNLAKARVEREKNLKRYAQAQKEKATSDMEKFFSKKIEEEVEKRLKDEKVKWMETFAVPKQEKKVKVVAETPKKTASAPTKKAVVKPKATKSKKTKTAVSSNDHDPFGDFC